MTDDIKVLVTGGTGLVGTALAQYVQQDRHEANWVFVSSNDANLLEWEQVRDLFAFHQPTHVVHLAAMVGGLFHNMSANLEFLMSNLQMNLNIVRACNAYGVRKLVSCMSTCIFPDDRADVLREDDMHSGPPHLSNFGYAYSKRMLDVINRAHAESADGDKVFTSIIPCNVYGPHDNFHLKHGHVIPALIHRAHLASQNDPDHKILKVAGTGNPLRQFIYSEDLAKLIVWVVDNYDSCEPIILAPEEEVSIGAAARAIAAARDRFVRPGGLYESVPV